MAYADGNFYVMADENHGYEMKILDVTYSNPIVVSTFFSGLNADESMPHNQIIQENYVYTAHYHDGLYVHDITDPLNPVLTAFYDTLIPLTIVATWEHGEFILFCHLVMFWFQICKLDYMFLR